MTNELPVVIGECLVTMENETRKTQATIAIIQGRIDSQPLLGRKILKDLGMVMFDASGRLKKPNRDVKTVHKVTTRNTDLDRIIHKYECRFQGVGQVKRDGRNVELLKQGINQFVQEGPQQEYIGWCSPFVVQPKQKSSKGYSSQS